LIKLGVIVLAATLAVVVTSFLRHRRRAFPARGWVGIAILACAELLMFGEVEPVATYFTPIAWTAYMLVADAALFALAGRSPMRNEPGKFARLALLSIPLWLIFEAYNLRLNNWEYVGLPQDLAARWLGYGWSFATIFPALLLTAEFVAALGWFSRAGRPWRLSRAAEWVLVGLGVALLVAPVALPRRIGAYLFALVWVGFALLLDPLLKKRGAASLLGEMARGNYARLGSLLVSGWICGWLWEFWNYWAAAKWHYIFPMFQQWKVFEMPVPGYLGFPPFAVEAYVMYIFAARLLGWPALFTPHAEAVGEEQPV
jgi:hypothetical protein